MGSVKLTRESILDGTLHASVRSLLGPNARFSTDAERLELLRKHIPDRDEHLVRYVGVMRVGQAGAVAQPLFLPTVEVRRC